MKRMIAVLAMSVVPLWVGLASAQTPAQSTAQPPAAPIAGRTPLGVTMTQIEEIVLGWSTKRDLFGKTVLNDKNEKIGKVDDLIVTPDGTLSIAVIDVGGFLGLAKHRVAIPVRQFAHVAPKAVLPGATKDQLKALPKFEYV
jgi:hypothetical protein